MANIKVARSFGAAISSYMPGAKEVCYAFKYVLDKMATIGWTVKCNIHPGDGYAYADLPIEFQTLLGGSSFTNYMTAGYFEASFDGRIYRWILALYSNNSRGMMGIYAEPDFVKAGITLPFTTSWGQWSQSSYPPSYEFVMGYNPIDKDYFISTKCLYSTYPTIFGVASVDSELSTETDCKFVCFGNMGNSGTPNIICRINNNLNGSGNVINTMIAQVPFSKNPTAYGKYYKCKIAVGESTNGFRGWLRNIFYIPPFTQATGNAITIAGVSYVGIAWLVGGSDGSYLAPADFL